MNKDFTKQQPLIPCTSTDMTAHYPELMPITEPLVGNIVIEASAGTGKTFTITTLLLRLLLGLNPGQKEPFKLEEILIVTFTNAATAELKERIFKRIIDLKRAILEQEEADPVLDELIETLKIKSNQNVQESNIDNQEIVDQGVDLETAVNLLIAAERSIDQASIFTIHGFSQRLLKENALNMGREFRFEIAENTRDVVREAIYYFWRQECYALTADHAQMVLEYFKAPESQYANSTSLSTLIRPFLQSPDLIEPSRFQGAKSLEALFTVQLNKINRLKETWLTQFSLEEFDAFIDQVGINRRSYNRTNMRRWHAEMTDWAQSSRFLPPSCVERFQYTFLASKLKEGGDLHRASSPLLEMFEAFETISEMPIAAIHYAAGKIAHHAAELKRDAQILGFDDILHELEARLSEATPELIAAIQSRYRAVMIDEFQDTDRIQLEIFRTLFFNAEEIPFVMIGDPKQSIYRFRGADINAYLGAKSTADRVRTLSTNYRSASSVIESINAFFTLADKGGETFLHSDIPFIEISSPTEAAEIELLIEENSSQSLTSQKLGGMTLFDFCPSDDELTFPKNGVPHVAVGIFKEAMAHRSALEVKRLLEFGRLRDGKKVRPVESSDITFLVRARSDAELILSVLKKHNLNAVYLSEKRSVFDPEVSIVSDLYLFLRSLIHRQDRALLMRSLSSILYGLSIEEYQALREDPQRFEILLEERNELLHVWRKHGVLAMLRTFIVQEGRLARLRSLEDGERLVSDLFHLGELLQAQKISTKEGLLAWLEEQMEEGREDSATLRLESDFKTIQVMTYHKSKGLEFPIVFIPFALRKPQPESEGIYEVSSREESYRRYLFKEEVDEVAKEYFRKEQLAEEIRFLYVALTRAKYHNFIGYTQYFKPEDYPQTALGHLLPEHETPGLLLDLCKTGVVRKSSFTTQMLIEKEQSEKERLKKIVEEMSSVGQLSLFRTEERHSLAMSTLETEPHLKAAKFTGSIETLWRFTSFSHLSYNADTPYFIPEKQDECELETHVEGGGEVNHEESLFPKGAITGNFIHALLENYAPEALQNREVLAHELQRNFAAVISEERFPALLDELEQWLYHILHAKLRTSKEKLPTLLEILSGDQHINELEFLFPVRKTITPVALTEILHQNIPREGSEGLSFDALEGMLRGFIDLTFEYNGQFFVADYKSNYLGPTPEFYTLSEMERSIKHAHYDLQYLIYTVALVKFLELHNPDFDYERDFGGVYYLYLRGMQAGEESGVYYVKPKWSLVQQLRAIFDEGAKEGL